MSRRRPTVVIGMLGPTLDSGANPARWTRWRPTVALCQHPDLVIDRLELLFDPKFRALADVVIADVKQVSPETEVRAVPLAIDDPWDFEEVYGALHDFARKRDFDPAREDYLVHITTGTHVAQICLFLLTESRHLPARLIQTSPARRGTGAEGAYAIIDLDLSRYDRLAARAKAEASDGAAFLKAGIATRNATFNGTIERIEHVITRTKAPLLIVGPTGAGKTALAGRIYERKRARRQVSGDFVVVNCATLRGDAAMSALFGHEKGAFTGALAARQGLLRKADGGVLFLDEIGELGLDEQAMLLRAIEEKSFYPMGSDRETKSDFQLVAGTNRDLSGAAQSGKFRADLLARIDLWTFALPGLRDRPEDIEPNLAHEIERASAEIGRRVSFNREARDRYVAFATSSAAAWTRNFRDLAGSVTRLATLAPSARITAELVDEEIARLAASWGHTSSDEVDRVLGTRAAELDRFDRVQLADVLAVCRTSPSLSAAGRTLFSASRARKTSANDADRLRKYLARFELGWADVRG
jgi:transcriptional regulatory protein RtcR